MPLPIDGCRIVAGKEDGKQIIEGNAFRIELDPDDFRMSGTPAAYGLVIRPRIVAAGIPTLDGKHADELTKYRIQTPETSAAEYRRLHGQSPIDLTALTTVRPGQRFRAHKLKHPANVD